MSAKSKHKPAPASETAPDLLPLEVGQGIMVHNHMITVMANEGGVVQFEYANGQRRALLESPLNEYRKHGAFPKGTLFDRFVGDELVEVKIMSIKEREYELDIQPEGVKSGLDKLTTYNRLMEWHMQPEHDEPAAAPEQDEALEAAAKTAVEAAIKADTARETLDTANETLDRLHAELKKREGYIDILQGERDTARRERDYARHLIDQLEIQVDALDRKTDILAPRKVVSKTICRDISDDERTAAADTELDTLISEGWEVAYEIVNCIPIDNGTPDGTRKDIRFIRLTRPVVTSFTGRRIENSASVGNTTVSAAMQPVPVTIIHSEIEGPVSVPLTFNRVPARRGATKRIPASVIAANAFQAGVANYRKLYPPYDMSRPLFGGV